jgi:hypothetical protein
MEHRWGERIAVDLPIDVATRLAPQARALLVNVSFTGALIKADFLLRIRSRIQIALKWPPQRGDEGFNIAAVVTHNHEQGIGVEWCHIGSAAVRRLLRAAPCSSAAGGLTPRSHAHEAGWRSTSCDAEVANASESSIVASNTESPRQRIWSPDLHAIPHPEESPRRAHGLGQLEDSHVYRGRHTRDTSPRFVGPLSVPSDLITASQMVPSRIV